MFVSAATKELMWLNDKEEEEVNYDWSDRNTNMTAKKDNYSVGLTAHSEKHIHNLKNISEMLLRQLGCSSARFLKPRKTLNRSYSISNLE